MFLVNRSPLKGSSFFGDSWFINIYSACIFFNYCAVLYPRTIVTWRLLANNTYLRWGPSCPTSLMFIIFNVLVIQIQRLYIWSLVKVVLLLLMVIDLKSSLIQDWIEVLSSCFVNICEHINQFCHLILLVHLSLWSL